MASQYRLTLVVLMLAACGRIAFDPRSDAGDVAPRTLLAVGRNHACAARDEAVYCWGDNASGLLGRGTTSAVDPAPAPIVVALPRVTALSSGGSTTLALDDTGAIWSWGDGGSHALGLSSPARPTPAQSPVLPGIVGIEAGVTNGCAWAPTVTTCWGDADGGQLPLGAMPDMVEPTAATVVVSSLALGTDHGCGIDASAVSGGLRCWGVNAKGQLGTDPALAPEICKDVDDLMVPCRVAPVAVPGVTGVRTVSGGYQHTCAIDGSGSVYCWGRNDEGELGIGTTVSQFTPVAVLDLPSAAVAVVAARYHSCALLDDASVWCWGRGSSGQLGNATTDDATRPVLAAIPMPVVSIDASSRSEFTCAVDTLGDVWCWGINDNSQLGVPTAIPGTPVRVPL